MPRLVLIISCIGAFLAVIFSFAASRILSPNSFPLPRLHIAQVYSSNDIDHDGVNDTQDILDGAREEVRRAPIYHSGYYQGGYPPASEGVCTDVVWRAFEHAGYHVKDLIDADIKKHLARYPRVDRKPDPNIDFRRVPNMQAFFETHATALTQEVHPGNVDNLKEWQGGDIVVFGEPHAHIGIISDQRDPDGVPYLIHNSSPHPAEQDALLFWHEHLSPIVGHYRWD